MELQRQGDRFHNSSKAPNTPSHAGRISVFQIRPLSPNFQPDTDHLPQLLPCLPDNLQILPFDAKDTFKVLPELHVAFRS